MNPEIEFTGGKFGGEAPVFIIAEVGINHNGDMALAHELLIKAHGAGADAVKLQTYKTEKRVAADSPIFSLLKDCELSHPQQAELFELGRELGITVFSTPFDIEAIDFLRDVGCELYKVASFDIVNRELLRNIAAIGRPVILSRGMATDKELVAALEIFDSSGVASAILHCVSAYPVPSVADLNLSTIEYLRQHYKKAVGFSDHTIGIEGPVWAVASGARIIEKHFTLDTKMDGPDHAISADPATLTEMVNQIRSVEQALGSPVHGPVEAEKDILQYRRNS